jgi:hypothetical protein
MKILSQIIPQMDVDLLARLSYSAEGLFVQYLGDEKREFISFEDNPEMKAVFVTFEDICEMQAKSQWLITDSLITYIDGSHWSKWPIYLLLSLSGFEKLGEIVWKFSDGHLKVEYFCDRLIVTNKFVEGDVIMFSDEPELESVWDGFSWDVTMLMNLYSEFEFQR